MKETMVRFDEEEYNKIVELGEQNERKVAPQIRYMVKQQLEQNKKE